MTEAQTRSWIFLALASQVEPANFESISQLADGINHAVPNHQELQSSILWLCKSGYAEKLGNKYTLTDKGKALNDTASSKSNTLMETWESLEKLIS